MNKKSLSVLLSFLLIWVLFTATAWAGQVVTDEVKAWAKGAIEQEKALKTVSAPNTVAVLYFSNKTGWSDLDILQKGLTLMLITDLSKVEEIQVVERVKVQALVEELDLEVSGLVKPSTSSQMGKLLGVELLVGGDILKGKIEELFQLKSNLLKVQTEKVVGRPWTEGELLAELFRMEKELLFEIIKELKIELSPELEAELKKPLTTNLTALLYLFEGIDHSDRGNYSKAAESYKKAMAEDPNLGQAEAFLWELQALNLWAGAIEAYSEPEGGGTPDDIIDELPDDRDLTEREVIYVDSDGDGMPDVDDGCPNDPNKIEPGICGCGVPEEWCEYMEWTVPQTPIVDISILIEAANTIVNDYDLLSRVVGGEFIPGNPQEASNEWGYEWSGPYVYGLQTVGQNVYDDGEDYYQNVYDDGEDYYEEPQLFMNPNTLELINNDPFLAYAVQVEEDRLNREILEMHRDAAAGELLDTINWQLASGEIRTRDDFLMQQADARAGRVLKDKNGHWVRVQQYVLRPNVQTVQVLNVCLRGADAGSLAGLSTIDWTTKFTESINGFNLRGLPWSDYLNTQGPQLPGIEGGSVRYVEFWEAPLLASMYVKFTSPAGDYLKESRSFNPSITYEVSEGGEQKITSETLTLSWDSTIYSYSKDVTQGEDKDEYWVYPDSDFIYSPQGKNPAPFYYMYRYGPYNDDPSKDQIAPLVMMDFFVVNDGDTDQNQGVSIDDYSGQSFRDIWDTLRVNEPGAPQIGNNNLEMAFKRGWSSTATIDVVYIPMSRMLWKTTDL
jgi:TolB-like protein